MPTRRSRRAPETLGERFAVLDPATGQPFDDAPDQQPDVVDAVVGRAHAAWRSWRADPVARATALLAAADAVEAAGADVAPLLTREQGKPLAESYAEVAHEVRRRSRARPGHAAEAGQQRPPTGPSRALHSPGPGGRRPSRGRRPPAGSAGLLFAPTILADVPPESPVVTQEQFGPVLPVLPYESLDEAVEAANDTGFGLGGSVWGTDLDRAEAVADRLECGTAWINHHAELSLAQPFAGIKQSGVGVAGGPWGLYGNLRPFVVRRPQEG
ncbi:aldehyde dehydrogenase family protein [Streptomyces sp. NPDC048638]|uniref:aldehyde dehydrogenase family protein n=1 Tax=Streptomyces sp. NPDC048638 TaxID=3365580 RepID=UPI00371473A5